MIHIRIDDQHISAKALLKYLKTLDFVSIDDSHKINEWQTKKLDELQTAADNGELKFEDWEKAKDFLSKKYSI